MTVTLKDIAKLANVDAGSVSRVLRKDPRAAELRPETREKILQIAKETGYRRNVSAATISTGVNSSTIAMICNVSGISDTFVQSYLFRIIRKIDDMGYGTRVYCSNDMDEIFSEIVSNQIRYIINYRTLFQDRKRSAELCRKHGLKMVFNTSIQEFPDFPVFDGNNVEITMQMVRHLYQLGHRDIGFFCGPHQYHTCTALRHQGFLRGIQECGMHAAPEMILCEEFGAELFLHHLKKYQPTAYCCINSSIALQMELTLLQAGIRVPQELSIITYGDAPELSKYTRPPLTSMRELDNQFMTDRIMKYFRTPESEKKPASEYTFFHSAELIQRESTAPPSIRKGFERKLEKALKMERNNRNRTEKKGE